MVWYLSSWLCAPVNIQIRRVGAAHREDPSWFIDKVQRQTHFSTQPSSAPHSNYPCIYLIEQVLRVPFVNIYIYWRNELQYLWCNYKRDHNSDIWWLLFFFFVWFFCSNYDYIPHKYCCLVFLHISTYIYWFFGFSAGDKDTYLFIPSTFDNESIYLRCTNLHVIMSWILIKVLLFKSNWQKICHCSELVWTSFQYKWAVL